MQQFNDTLKRIFYESGLMLVPVLQRTYLEDGTEISVKPAFHIVQLTEEQRQQLARDLKIDYREKSD